LADREFGTFLSQINGTAESRWVNRPLEQGPVVDDESSTKMSYA